jgi:hypothetical protein
VTTTKPKAERPKSPGDRLDWILRRVRRGIKTDGDRAALEAVRRFVTPKPMARIAAEAGMTRSDLHVLLTVSRGRLLHQKRRDLEKVLKITPGGMGVILAPVEDYINKNGGA